MNLDNRLSVNEKRQAAVVASVLDAAGIAFLPTLILSSYKSFMPDVATFVLFFVLLGLFIAMNFYGKYLSELLADQLLEEKLGSEYPAVLQRALHNKSYSKLLREKYFSMKIEALEI